MPIISIKRHQIVFYSIILLIFFPYSFIFSKELVYLQNVNYIEKSEYTQITIFFSDFASHEYRKLIDEDNLDSPYRLYIDFSPSQLESDLNNTVLIDNSTIRKIRISQFDKSTSRVIFDLKKDAYFEVSTLSNPYRVVVDFKDTGLVEDDKSNALTEITDSHSMDKDESHNLKIADSFISGDSEDYENESDNLDDKKNDKNQTNSNFPEETFTHIELKRSDTFDPDSRPPLTIKVNDKLSLGGKVNFELEWRENNEDLDKDKQDTITTFESQLSLAGLFNPKPNIDIYAEGRLTDLQVLEDEPDEKDESNRIRLKRGYLFWRNFIKNDYDIQLGRQRIKDDREWIFDENLDAVRFYYEPKPFSIEFSLSTLLMDGKRDSDKTINYILYSQYKYAEKQKVALYSVIRQDRNGSSEDRFFFGTSWRARPFSRHNIMWLDSAISIQRDDNKDFIQGFGMDVGITKRFRVAWQPSFTIAFAFGSNNFRQTGLEDNNAKFNGKTKFKYYGELLDPELANLYIGTLGFGIIPRKSSRTSLDIVYHYLSQIEKKDKLEDSDIDEDPTGEDKDIGHELDLIIGSSITKYIKLSFTGGIFFPGDAFEENDTAYFAEFKLQFVFK